METVVRRMGGIRREHDTSSRLHMPELRESGTVRKPSDKAEIHPLALSPCVRGLFAITVWVWG